MSNYDYYNRNKKKPIFSWRFFFKMVGFILLGYVAFFGIAILVLYLTGQMDEKKIPPNGIEFSLSNSEKENVETINGTEIYTPKLNDSNGEYSFKLHAIDSSVVSNEETESDTANNQEANQLEISVDISNDRILKLVTENPTLNSPLEFSVQKDSDGYVVGGYVTITIRSADGVYGSSSITVFIDSPVQGLENNVLSNNNVETIEKLDETQITVCNLFIGDELSLNAPTFIPSQSKNPSNGSAYPKKDKSYEYVVEYYYQDSSGASNWIRLDDNLNYNKDNTTVTRSGNTLKTVKTGYFRVRSSAYPTYEIENNPPSDTNEREYLVFSEYTYYKISEISYSGIETSLKSYTFDYIMANKNGLDSLTTYRLYLNSTKSKENLARVNGINLGMTINLPKGYNFPTSNTMYNALSNVYMTIEESDYIENGKVNNDFGYVRFNETSNESGYYYIKGDEDESNGIKPIKDNDGSSDYYYELKVVHFNPSECKITFKLQSNDESGNVLETKFTLKSQTYDSTLNFITINETPTTSDYGSFSSLTLKKGSVSGSSGNADAMIMNVVVDSDKNEINLNKLVEIKCTTEGKTSSFDRIKFFIYLGSDDKTASENFGIIASQLDADSYVTDYSEYYSEDETKKSYVEFDNGKYGLEIANGIFCPNYYVDYTIYAVLVQTDYTGKIVKYVSSGYYAYKSAEVRVYVQVPLTSVDVEMCDSSLNALSSNDNDKKDLKESQEYYLHITVPENAKYNTESASNILDLYYKNLYVSTSSDTKDIKDIVSVGEFEYEHIGSGNSEIKGYFAKVNISKFDNSYNGETVNFTIYYQDVESGSKQFAELRNCVLKRTSVIKMDLLKAGSANSVTNETGATNVEITASVSETGGNGQISWVCYSYYYDKDGNKVEVQNGAMDKDESGNCKYYFGVDVDGEDTSVTCISNSSSVSVAQTEGTNIFTLIVDSGAENYTSTPITITIRSNNNADVTATITLTISTPNVTFELKKDDEGNVKLGGGVSLSSSENNYTVTKGSSEYSYKVYSGAKVNILDYIQAKAGNTSCDNLLNFSFALKESENYAKFSADKSTVEFTKNPEKTTTISVYVELFSSRLTFTFNLNNNLVVKYRTDNLSSMFNKVEDAFTGNEQQTKIVMSKYNNMYYPTIVKNNTTSCSINLADFILFGYYNANGTLVTSTNYSSFDTGTTNPIDNFTATISSMYFSSITGMILKNKAESNALISPKLITLTISPKEELGGASVSFTVLLVPDIKVEQRTQDILIKENGYSFEVSSDNSSTKLSNATYFIPTEIVFTNDDSKEEYLLDSSDNTNIELVLNSKSVFSLCTFAGTQIEESTFADYFSNDNKKGLKKYVSYGNLEFVLDKNSDNGYRISSSEANKLVVDNKKVLTKQKLTIVMKITSSSEVLSISRTITIIPYYMLSLNDNNNYVVQAQNIAKATGSAYLNIVENNGLSKESSMVMYVGQAFNLKEILVIKTRVDSENGFTYNLNETQTSAYASKFTFKHISPGNITRLNGNEVTGVQMGGSLYSTINILCDNVSTEFILNLFVCDNINIYESDANNSGLKVSEKLGLQEVAINNVIGANESEVTDVTNEVKTTKKKESIDDKHKVKANQTIVLTDMYKVKSLISESSYADLEFEIDAEMMNFAQIIAEGSSTSLKFEESAKDLIIKLTIKTNKNYLKATENLDKSISYSNEEIIWERYFVLLASQSIEIEYPFENNAESVFLNLYDDDEKNIVGANGYIKLKMGDALVLGTEENSKGIIRAYETESNADVYDSLTFTVYEYNSGWQKSSLYSISQKTRTITIPTVTGDQFTRIYVTSTSGLEAFVNVYLVTERDDKTKSFPTLYFSYPTATAHTSLKDSKQYEYRTLKETADEKIKTDTVKLSSYDDNFGVTRIQLNPSDITSSRLYYEVYLTKINETETAEISGVTCSISNGVLSVTTDTDNGYKNEEFVVRVKVRTDYGYYKESGGEFRTYNIYYGGNISIEEKDKMITLESDKAEDIAVDDLFDIIVVDGTTDYVKEYSIDSLTTYTSYSIIDNNGSYILRISYNANRPSGDIVIKLTIKDKNGNELACKDCKLEINPREGTISDNSKENPSIIACAKTQTHIINLSDIKLNLSLEDGVSVTQTANSNSITLNFTDGRTIPDSGYYTYNNIIYKNLFDDVELTIKVNDEEKLFESVTFNKTTINLVPNTVYSLKTGYIFLDFYNGTTCVMSIPYYVEIYPTYKLSTGATAEAKTTTDNKNFAQIYSGSEYDVYNVSNPVHFVLEKTEDGTYSASQETDKVALSYTLVDGNLNYKQNLTVDDNLLLKDSNGIIYAKIVDGKLEFRISPTTYNLRISATVSATVKGYTGQEICDSYQEIYIQVVANINSTLVNVYSSTAKTEKNSELNPIILDTNSESNGLDISSYLTINVVNSNNLLSSYSTDLIKTLLKEISSTTSTTFSVNSGSEDVLSFNVEGLKIIKNTSYTSSETIVHSITFYIGGVNLFVVYISIARDYAYSFDSSFSTMYACDKLDLSLLANNFIGQNETTLNGTVTYEIASTCNGVKISDSILTVDETNQQEEQDVTLIATCVVGSTTETAKTQIKILPTYAIAPKEIVYYNKEASNDDVEITKTGIKLVVASGDINKKETVCKIKIDNNSINVESIRQEKFTYNTGSVSTVAYYITNENDIKYSPKEQNATLISGLDVELKKQVGSFFLEENNSTKYITSLSNITFYEVNDATLTECKNGLLTSAPSLIDTTKYIVVEATANYEANNTNYTSTVYGMFSITLSPSAKMNLNYTNNTQQISIFNALQDYSLLSSSCINISATNAEFSEDVDKGNIKLDVKLYDDKGSKVSSSSTYYTITDYVTIGSVVYTLTQEQSTQDQNKTIYKLTGSDGSELTTEQEDNSKKFEMLGNMSISYNATKYKIDKRINFTDLSIGYSALLTVTYGNDNWTKGQTISKDYFIKVDAMKLNLTAKENVTLVEGSQIEYTIFVESDSNANKATKVTFTSGSTYYEVVKTSDTTAKINNSCNIFDVKVPIIITFEFAGGKKFVYTATFTLKSQITIKNQVTSTNNSVTDYQFDSSKVSTVGNTTFITASDNVLGNIIYTQKTQNDYKNYQLLTSIILNKDGTKETFKVESVTITNETTTKHKELQFVTTDNNGDKELTDTATMQKKDSNGILQDLIKLTFVYDNDVQKLKVEVNSGTFNESESVDITLGFSAGNQATSTLVSMTRVGSTAEFTLVDNDNKTTISRITLEGNDLSFTVSNVKFQIDNNDVSDTSKVSAYISDDSIVTFTNTNNITYAFKAKHYAFDSAVLDKKVNEGDIVVAVTKEGNTEKKKYYLVVEFTINYVDNDTSTYHTTVIPIYVEVGAITPKVVTNGKATFTTKSSDDFFSSATLTSYAYKLSYKTTGKSEVVEDVKSSSDISSDSKLKEYFSYENNEFTAKSTFYTAVSLSLYTNYKFNDSGQTFTLTQVMTIESVGEPIFSAKSDDETEEKVISSEKEFVYNASNAKALTFSVDKNLGLAVSVNDEKLTVNDKTVTFTYNPNQTESYAIPITLTATAGCGEEYKIVVYYIALYPNYSYGNATLSSTILNVGENLPTLTKDSNETTRGANFGQWWKVIKNTTETTTTYKVEKDSTATKVESDAVRYIYVSYDETEGKISGNESKTTSQSRTYYFEIFNVLHTYDIELELDGSNWSSEDTLTYNNNVKVTVPLQFKYDGEVINCSTTNLEFEKEDGTTVTSDDDNCNFGISLDSTNKKIIINPVKCKNSGGATVEFKITVTYNGVNFIKYFTITYTNVYSSDDVTDSKSVVFAYNNGIEYSQGDLFNLKNYSYTDEKGVEYVIATNTKGEYYFNRVTSFKVDDNLLTYENNEKGDKTYTNTTGYTFSIVNDNRHVIQTTNILPNFKGWSTDSTVSQINKQINGIEFHTFEFTVELPLVSHDDAKNTRTLQLTLTVSRDNPYKAQTFETSNSDYVVYNGSLCCVTTTKPTSETESEGYLTYYETYTVTSNTKDHDGTKHECGYIYTNEFKAIGYGKYREGFNITTSTGHKLDTGTYKGEEAVVINETSQTATFNDSSYKWYKYIVTIGDVTYGLRYESSDGKYYEYNSSEERTGDCGTISGATYSREIKLNGTISGTGDAKKFTANGTSYLISSVSSYLTRQKSALTQSYVADASNWLFKKDNNGYLTEFYLNASTSIVLNEAKEGEPTTTKNPFYNLTTEFKIEGTGSTTTINYERYNNGEPMIDEGTLTYGELTISTTNMYHTILSIVGTLTGTNTNTNTNTTFSVYLFIPIQNENASKSKGDSLNDSNVSVDTSAKVETTPTSKIQKNCYKYINNGNISDNSTITTSKDENNKTIKTLTENVKLTLDNTANIKTPEGYTYKQESCDVIISGGTYTFNVSSSEINREYPKTTINNGDIQEDKYSTAENINELTFVENALNYVTTDTTNNKNETKISKYVVVQGVYNMHAGIELDVVTNRYTSEENKKGASKNFTITCEDSSSDVIISDSKVKFDAKATNTQEHIIKIKDNAKNFTFTLILKPVKSYTYSFEGKTIELESTESRTIELADLGSIKYQEGSNGEKYELPGNQNYSIAFTSLNEDIIKVENNTTVTAGFVLEDTQAKLQVTFTYGSQGNTFIFYVDIYVKASINIQVEEYKEYELGSNIDLSELYKVYNGASLTSLTEIDSKATVSYEMIEEKSTETVISDNIITAQDTFKYAGKLLTIKIIFNVSNKTLERQVTISIASELYQLNLIDDVFTLHSGQSVDLNYIHLKFQNADGTYLNDVASIGKVDYDSKYLTVDGTKITAKNVFKDVSTSISFNVTLKDGSTRKCSLDVYILQSYYTTYSVNNNGYAKIESVAVDTELTIADIINQAGIVIKDYNGNVINNTNFKWKLSSSYIKDAISLNKNNKEIIKITYDIKNQTSSYIFNLDIYNVDEENILQTITVQIEMVKNSRQLSYCDKYNENTVIDCSKLDSSSINLITTLFNKYLKYMDSDGKISEGINLDWLEVSCSAVGIVIDKESSTSTLTLTNTNNKGFATADQVTVIIKDVNTLESVSIQIIIARSPSASNTTTQN